MTLYSIMGSLGSSIVLRYKLKKSERKLKNVIDKPRLLIDIYLLRCWAAKLQIIFYFCITMIYEELVEQIAQEFHIPFTSKQREAAEKLARFLVLPRPQAAFILRGYAGTGKTSLVGALVRVMQKLERPVQLLAPTGRAAKVFSAHAGTAAYTIHKAIYRQQSFNGEGTRFSLGFN